MEKRAILAIVLSLLVVLVWSIFFAPAPPPVEPPPAEREVQRGPSPSPAGDERQRQPAAVPPPVEAATPSTPAPETLVQVHTGVARLNLTSLGAGVKSVDLLAYRASIEENAPPTRIAPLPGAFAIPLRADLMLGSRTVRLQDVTFTPTRERLELSEARPDGAIEFRGQTPDGVVIVRVFRFYYGHYDFEVSTHLEGIQPPAGSAMTLYWGPGLRQEHEAATRRRQNGTTARHFINGKVSTDAPETVGEAMELQGSVGWTALTDTYFTAVLIPQAPPADTVLMRLVQKDELEVGLRTPLGSGRPEQTVRVYVGPKKQDLLKTVDPSLGRLIDLGFFSPLARPMLQLLRFINSMVHNYGVTIIIVTVLIKIAFWPLTQKSYKSMQAMQRLQPKMKELQVIYKDDRQALNRAMMQLYREQKVNPMGGCLPMLLQIPFFFAFYNALLYAIELRHAPFICWDTELFWVGRGICDLSVHDPSYITPLLMGVSMFVQQKMTPTTGDPTQAKIMQFMPLIFLFFFLKAPAGLVIYWLMNNVLSIVQQLLVNRSRQLETAKAEAAGKG